MPLRPFSSRMFPSSITVRRVTHGSGDRGGDPAAPGSGTSIAARVLEVTRPTREDGDNQVFGAHAYEVTTPTDPGLAVDDRIDWGTRVLSVIASPVDMGGEGRRWRTYCREVS